MSKIYDLMRTLGLKSTYRGYEYLAYAVDLCVRDRDYLQLITKWLYPDVGKHFNTSSKCVERNLRTLITSFWRSDRRKQLNRLAGHRLTEQPTTGEFISILADYLRIDDDKIA